MRNETSYLAIGLFVIAGLALLAAGLVALGVGIGGREVILAESYFADSVSGLEPGAPVRFRGVTIGRVHDIAVAPALYEAEGEPYAVVRFTLWSEKPETYSVAELREALSKRIEEGLRVRLASSGLTGVAYLELDLLESPKPYPPKRATPIGEEPDVLYIPATASDLTRVVDSVEKVLSSLQKADVEALVGNASTAFAAAATALQGLDGKALQEELLTTLRTTRKAVEDADLPAVSRRARDVLDTTSDAAKRVAHAATSFDELVGKPQAVRMLENLEQASRALADTAEAARTALGDLRGLVAGRGQQVDEILADVRRIAADLRAILATARDYPSWVLFGEPPPRRSRH